MSRWVCPFCREVLKQGDQTHCPLCGVKRMEVENHPSEVHIEEEQTPLASEHAPLPLTDLGHGRGVLIAFAWAGMAVFFLPWIHVTLPETVDLSGVDLARKLGWVWASEVAWFTLLPLVVSRRSRAQLQGARVPAFFLSAIPSITIMNLLMSPPKGRLVPLRFTYGWPLWATLCLSIAACVIAVARLGGEFRSDS